MSDIIIAVQPDSGSLNVAYRPIVFWIAIDSIPPVMYCDIYINDGYYGSISKTMYKGSNGSVTVWEFDIQTEVQTYLGKYLGANGGSDLENASPLIATVQCQFRASTIDPDGFIVPDAPIPIQATSSSAAVPGDAQASNNFFVLNSTLQQQDNQNLPQHLGFFKLGTWGDNSWPLTHRPAELEISKNDSDFFPIISDEVDECGQSIVLHYRLKGYTDFSTESSSVGEGACNAVLSNLVVLVSGTRVTASWDPATGAEEYEVDLNGSSDTQSSTNFDFGDLPAGDYTLAVTPQCACADGTGQSLDFSVADDATCVPVTIDGQTLDDAIVGAPYAEFINLTGTAPFTLVSSSLPDWMSAIIDGSTVFLSGTPTDADTGEAVTVTVSNCTDDEAEFSQTIDITAPDVVQLPSIGYGVASGDACTSHFHVWIRGASDITPGITVYTDNLTTTILTGQNYIRNTIGQIFYVDIGTGIVGAYTGVSC